MPDIPAAPQVTISDPARPGAPLPAVPADRGALWRPSRTMLLGTLGAVLLVLGTTGAVSDHRQRAHERALDRAAVAALSLALVDPAHDLERREGQVNVALRNDSGQDVRVVRARVDDLGYRWQRVDLPLGPGVEADLVLSSTPVCRPELAEQGPARLLLEVRTSRGTVAPVEVRILEGAFGSHISLVARAQCGIAPLSQSLSAALVPSGRTSPTSLLVDTGLRDESVLPLEVTGVAGPDGFRASTTDRLPLAVPPRPAGQDAIMPAASRLRVNLQADCAYWAGHRTTEEPTASIVFLMRRGTTRASVELADDTATAAVRAAVRACRN